MFEQYPPPELDIQKKIVGKRLVYNREVWEKYMRRYHDGDDYELPRSKWDKALVVILMLWALGIVGVVMLQHPF